MNQMMRKMYFICVITGNYHDKRSSWVEKSMGVVILLLFFCQNGSKKVLGGDIQRVPLSNQIQNGNTITYHYKAFTVLGPLVRKSFNTTCG